jgi:hypothetical protein
MVEIVTFKGPLDTDRLGWIAALYGRVDPKYAELAFLEHLFSRAPAGPALHVFALADDRPVGHCAVVPMLAGNDVRTLLCGKVEALFVDESCRGRRGDAPPVAMQMRDRLYELAGEKGIELLHAYVRPEVGRILDLTPIRVGERSLVAVVRPWDLNLRGQRAVAVVLGSLQSVLRAIAAVFLWRWSRTSSVVGLRLPAPEDIDLVSVPPPTDGRWSVLVQSAWEWHCSSPYLRVLEIAGARGSRALVQLPGSSGEALRLIGWLPRRKGPAPALLLLGAVFRLARRRGAGTVRFQPTAGRENDATLRRACRLLGYLARDDFTTLYVRSQDAMLGRANAVAASPLFYLGF